ncbi:MAG TPA: hypothetical protein VIL98_02135, partial [Gaiellaceae bacterium]
MAVATGREHGLFSNGETSSPKPFNPFGLFLFGLAIVLILESKLGLSPWDVLNQGLSKHTPLSFGTANVAVALVILLAAWALGGPPGFATFANAILI